MVNWNNKEEVKRYKQIHYIRNKEKNKERIKEYNKNRYLLNKEEIKKKNKRWRDKNPEKIRNLRKNYNKKFKKENPDYAKEWRRNNVEKCRKYVKTHSKKYPIKIKMRNYTRSIRNELINETTKCSICGDKKNLEIHHLKYTKNKEDLMVVCEKCHRKLEYEKILMKDFIERYYKFTFKSFVEEEFEKVKEIK